MSAGRTIPGKLPTLAVSEWYWNSIDAPLAVESVCMRPSILYTICVCVSAACLPGWLARLRSGPDINITTPIDVELAWRRAIFLLKHKTHSYSALLGWLSLNIAQIGLVSYGYRHLGVSGECVLEENTDVGASRGERGARYFVAVCRRKLRVCMYGKHCWTCGWRAILLRARWCCPSDTVVIRYIIAYIY